MLRAAGRGAAAGAENDDLAEAAIKAAQELRAAYTCLSSSKENRDEGLPKHARHFCLQYVALSDREPEFWHLTPKLHLWLELCESGASPAATWTYRDEEWGGMCSKMHRRRWGVKCQGPFPSN